MIRTLVAGAAIAIMLSGCVVDNVATTVATDATTVVSDVGSLVTATNVVSPTVISKIQSGVAAACSFVPTAEVIANIAGTFSTTVASGSALVTPIVNDICSSVKASTVSTTKLSARRFGVENTVQPGVVVTVGTVNGVAVEGYFVK